MRNEFPICLGKKELKCHCGLCVLLFVWRDNKTQGIESKPHRRVVK